jgi:DNA-nicking Smr family endonuclease
MSKKKHPFEQLKTWKAPPQDKSKSPPAPARPPAQTKEEEELTFHRLMSGVTPLGARGHRPERATTEGGAAAREDEEARARLRALVEGGAHFQVVDDGAHVEGRRVDVGPDVLRKLRRGSFPIDARLDLHGLGAGDARRRVELFLREQRANGERCVLVIHGKGEGVLRGEIAAWLSQGAGGVHVEAFATALGKDGGEGAVYVLLRRGAQRA